jgi:fimbrial chaperone protein
MVTGRPGSWRAWAMAAAVSGILAPAIAGDFGVTPVRLDLDRSNRSAAITVSNQGDSPLSFQIRAMEWTQDEKGADRYADTNDLIYFPQQLLIPPNESRVVRVGYRNPARERELAYRLFIEELAPPPPPGTAGTAAVAMSVRFGVPVFLLPPTVAPKAEIAGFSIAAGRLRGAIRSVGSVHIRPTSVRVRGLDGSGATAFEQVFEGWYVLAGNERPYEAPVAAEPCRKARTIRVEVTGDKLDLKSDFSVPSDACGP